MYICIYCILYCTLYIGLIASYKGELKWLQGDHPLSLSTTTTTGTTISSTTTKGKGEEVPVNPLSFSQQPLKSGGESKGDDDIPSATAAAAHGGTDVETVLELNSLQLSFDVDRDGSNAALSGAKVNNSIQPNDHTQSHKHHPQQGTHSQGLDRNGQSSSRYSRAYVMKHDLTFLRAGFEELQRCRQVSLLLTVTYCHLLLISLTHIVYFTLYTHYLLNFSLLSPDMVIILTTSLASERILRLRILLLRRRA